MDNVAKINLVAPSASETRGAGWLSAINLSARRLLVFVLLLSVFTMTAKPFIDPDFWWHLRTGQFILETRTIPHTDIFSFTAAGKEWVTHEWLTEIFMALLYRVSGWGGLIVAFSLIMTGAFWIAYRRCARQAKHPYVAGAAVLLGAFASAPSWGVRPQMISFLFASVYVWMLGEYARGERKRGLWWLVPLMLVWVNLHGGFALGLALIGLTGVGVVLDEAARGAASVGRVWVRLRPLCVVFAGCVLAVPLNPNGLRMFMYPVETLSSKAMQAYIQEWFSPDFHQLMGQPFAALLFATFAALALSPKRVRPGELLLLLFSGYLALRAWRNIPFFALIAMPLLAEHAWSWLTAQSWGRWLLREEKRETGRKAVGKYVFNAMALIVIPLAVCGARVAHTAARQPEVEVKEYPSAAVEFLRAHAQSEAQAGRQVGPIFNSYGWGGYLIWKLYPEQRVYIDGRADVYGDNFMHEFVKAEDGHRDWRAPLERYGVQTVIIAPNVPLVSFLRGDGAWRTAFEDRQAVVFVKQ